MLSRQARKLRNPKEFGRPFAVLDQNSGLLIEKPDYQRMVEWTKKERRKWKKRQENKPFLDKLVLTHLIKASFGQAAETDVSYVNPNILFGVFMEHHENRHRKKNVDYEQAWGESWQVTYRLISEMQKETINAGSKFMIMTVPAKVQIDEKFQNLVENQFGKLDLNYTLPENKLMKFCSESGISCLDLYSAFKTGNSKTPLFHKYIDRHWNKHGHQIAAKEAAKFVKENKLIAPGEQ